MRVLYSIQWLQSRLHEREFVLGTSASPAYAFLHDRNRVARQLTGDGLTGRMVHLTLQGRYMPWAFVAPHE